MSKKPKSNKPPSSSTHLLADNKYNYLSSDNGGTSTSVAGIGYTQYSDDNLSEHHNKNKNQLRPSNHHHNNPPVMTNKHSYRYYRRKKHSKSSSNPNRHSQAPPNMAYPPYYPYPPYPPNNTQQHHQNTPYYYYPAPAPYPYPYPYPAAIPIHGDVAITQSFTPPDSRSQSPVSTKQRHHMKQNIDNQTREHSPIHPNDKGNENARDHGQSTQQQQMAPYYYWPHGPTPYFAHGPPQSHAANAPYPYNMNPYTHFIAPPQNQHMSSYGNAAPKRDKTGKKKEDIEQYEEEDDTKVPNAEPTDDVNVKNKLFSDLDGYENDEAPQKTIDVSMVDTFNASFTSQQQGRAPISQSRLLPQTHKKSESPDSKEYTNCLKVCILLCDMENAFEIIEILILFTLIAFIGVWWADRGNTVLLLSLAGCSSIFGLLVLNMRRAQSSLRLHELGSTLNDFRFILFVIGLCVVIAADQLRYAANNTDERYLWMAHSFVWIVAGMLWCTIDFATYMSYFVSSSYHIFILIATTMEFAKVCWQIANPNDIPSNLYTHNNVLYTLYDFKIDGLLLMMMVEVSTIITLIKDRKREWYCFGLSNVYRHRMLQISRRQERIIQQRMVQSLRNGRIGMGSVGSSVLINNVSGNRFYMHGNNEDSLLLIWIINLSVVAYMTFFLWDLHSSYKSIPAAIGILAYIVLIYRECDFHLVVLMKQQTHFWFLSMAITELWFVTIYMSFFVDKSNKEDMWKEIGSYIIDSTMFTMGVLLVLMTDLLVSSVSTYFIIRGTIPTMMLCVSLFSGWYLSFNSNPIQSIKWPISIVSRNGYYILFIISSISIIKWIRDPNHKYFIFIQHRRKRTILHEYKYRNQHENNLLFDNREHSITITHPLATKSRSLLLGPSYLKRTANDNQINQIINTRSNHNNNYNHHNDDNDGSDDDDDDEQYQQMTISSAKKNDHKQRLTLSKSKAKSRSKNTYQNDDNI